MTTPEKEVEQMFPSGKVVTLKTKEYTIKPFGFGQFPKVLNLFKGIQDTSATAKQGISKNDLMSFVMANSEIVVDFAMLATKEKREFFDDVPMDEAVLLVQAILEVNVDFFTSRLLPVVMEMLSKLTVTAGAVSSQLSLQTDTV